MSALRLIALAAACAAALGGNALAGGVLVPMDNVTLVAFKKPVSTVYIGNASIAQVTMLDSRHVFVLGKRFGVTNLIALRADRSVLSNETVLVSARTGGAVTIFRGADTFNYACSSFHCETRPVPGDQKTYYDNTEDSAIKHEDAGNKGTTIATQQR
jgi:putative type II/III system pilus formation protein